MLQYNQCFSVVLFLFCFVVFFCCFFVVFFLAHALYPESTAKVMLRGSVTRQAQPQGLIISTSVAFLSRLTNAP